MGGLKQLFSRLFSVHKSIPNNQAMESQRDRSYFEADTLDDLLAEVYRAFVNETSELTASRGSFLEFTGCLLVLNNPRARLSRSENRGKLFSGLAELLWYLSKENHLAFMEYYLKGRYVSESEDGKTVRSAYGERLFSINSINQIDNVIRVLTKKATSRRAVIQLFDASDLVEDFKSIPCTCTLQFIGRGDKLHLLVNMRSNDVFKGLPHDVFSFTMLQEIIARSVNLDVGTYKHCVGSLHLYTNDDEEEAKRGNTTSDRDKVLSYLNEGYFTTTPMPPMPAGDPWAAIECLRKFEESARVNGNILAHDICGSDYWNDLCRLLAFFRHYQNAKTGDTDHLAKCHEIKAQMSSKAYDIFLAAKIDHLENTK